MDIKIASIVLARDTVLVTRNKADFVKIPELKIQDWSRKIRAKASPQSIQTNL